MQKGQTYSIANVSLIAKITLFLTLIVTVFGLTGCKTERIGNKYVTTAIVKPIDVANEKLKAPKELTLPISGDVYIDISDSDSTFKGNLCPGYSAGRFVRIAAVDVFQKGFTNAFSEFKNAAESRFAHLVVRTKSEVKMNCDWGYFNTTITSRIFKADGSLIGEYTESKRASTFIMDIAGINTKLQNTFVKMHIDILAQFLSDDKLLSLHQEGYFALPPMLVEF